MSSLFTALTFWAILKWEAEAESKYAGRWIIFIAYLLGLSVGVHLLNLLAIPAVVLSTISKTTNSVKKDSLKPLSLLYY